MKKLIVPDNNKINISELTENNIIIARKYNKVVAVFSKDHNDLYYGFDRDSHSYDNWTNLEGIIKEYSDCDFLVFEIK